MNQLSLANVEKSNLLKEKLLYQLSHYTIYLNNKNSKQEELLKSTDYFLNQDNWCSMDEVFSALLSTNLVATNGTYRNIYISFANYKNKDIKLEVKAYVKTKITTTWKREDTLRIYNQSMRIFGDFINEYYPNIKSILDIDLDEGNKNLGKYLLQKSYKSFVVNISEDLNTEVISRSKSLTFLDNVYKYIKDISDTRSEWEKDIWDIRNLPNTIKGSTIGGHYLCRFDQITNVAFRGDVKRYCKKRLLGNNKFKFSSAAQYTLQISKPLNFFSEKYPHWTDLKDLTSKDIEAYMEYLTAEATSKSSNPAKYIRQNLVIFRTFLEDVQTYEWGIAPKKAIGSIIHEDFLPSLPKKSQANTFKYIPDTVLEQLVTHFNELPPTVRMVVLIMMQTGLRISDTLLLKYDCLIERNGNYAIRTDIQKTSIIDHEIPVVGEFINIFKQYANHIKELSTPFNNPQKYLFNKFSIGDPTKTLGSRGISMSLNKLAIRKNIVDEDGKIYHFKNHAFRHTFAVKMINNNMCLVLLQDILGHTSADMTLTYAKLVDDTKQKEFKRLYKEGVFNYIGDSFEEVDFEEKLKEVNWNWEWVHHKMHAINTPYGTCLQRANGGCTFATQPPCLTCQNGKPCKHLLISTDDVPKYQIHINSAQELIKQAEINNRLDWIGNNRELLDLYNDILNQIKDGNLIFGNMKHLKS